MTDIAATFPANPAQRRVILMGTRGVPAAHGGFETFVAKLATYLTARSWAVVVFCQHEGEPRIWADTWKGVERINIAVRGNSTRSTVVFDWLSMRHAMRQPGLLFSFGYPTAIFALWPRLRGRRHLINMDGVEWKRSQHGIAGKIFLYVNERLAAAFGNTLVADHPRIADHLATRAMRSKIRTIAYGAEPIGDVDPAPLARLGVEPDRFAVIIARPEPDNSFLELVRAFSRRSRGHKLLVLGRFRNNNTYHEAVQAAASNDVIFPGAIYDPAVVHALRRHARFHAHGHRVGGTNPSLVEALGAGSAVLAHDNHFNSWVAGNGAVYFSTEDEIDTMMVDLFADDDLIARLRRAARARFEDAFTWPKILAEYESLLIDEARHVRASDDMMSIMET